MVLSPPRAPCRLPGSPTWGSRSSSCPQQADESLDFEEQILEAAKSIAAATSALVKAASAAQRELVAQGKVGLGGRKGRSSTRVGAEALCWAPCLLQQPSVLLSCPTGGSHPSQRGG